MAIDINKPVMKGVDLSHWNGKVDFAKLKAGGCDFVILKAAGTDSSTAYKDSTFYSNYQNATAAGLHVGAYCIVGSKCITASAGLSAAIHFRNILGDLKLDMPVYIDCELTSPDDKKGATDAAVKFLQNMEANGYFAGIYASDVSGFAERLDDSRLSKYAHWVARYNARGPQVVKDFGIWQYSSSGTVKGVKGYVDMDKCYVDYPKIIQGKHFNHY